MRCPRCHGETGHAAIRCADCGAPLVLPEDPVARPLDRTLDLDRRLGALGPDGHAPLAPATPEDLTAGGAAPLLAVPPPGTVIELRRAGTGRRALAWAIDGLPFGLGGLGLVAGLGGGDLAVDAQLVAVAALASLAYQTLAHWLAGATLGKRLLRLQVVGPDGERPGPGRSALRAVAAVTGTLLLGLGPLLALFTGSGQGLHDLLAHTVVVDAP
jgi:uncharacterized RDD family membrane protein YckC